MVKCLARSMTAFSIALATFVAHPGFAQSDVHPKSKSARSLRVFGLLQTDHVTALSAGSNQLASLNIRRGRLGVKGNILKEWSYRGLIEVAVDGLELIDAEIGYTGLAGLTLSVGQSKEAFGLEWSSPAPWWTFADRALVASLAPKRSVGFQASTGGARWRVSAGIHDENREYVGDKDKGQAVTMRLHGQPVVSGRTLVHLGASVSHRWLSDDDAPIILKSKFETSASPKPTLKSAPIDNVNAKTITGLEVLLMHKALSVQAEVTHLTIDRAAAPNISFASWYVQTSWFLNGGQRGYKAKVGGFGPIKPKTSAWELAARFDTLDLSDREIRTGSMDRGTLGLNWYANARIRMTVNLISAWIYRGTAKKEIAHSVLTRLRLKL